MGPLHAAEERRRKARTGELESIASEAGRAVSSLLRRARKATPPQFDPERECMTVLLLNTRRRVEGHQVIGIGTLDSVIIHTREVYRSAIIAAAHSIARVHNHPSGNPEPSEADLRITKDIARAGQLLKIELLDPIVIGHGSHASLREMGYLSR